MREVMCRDRVRNEEVRKKTGVMIRVGWSRRVECVEVVWTHERMEENQMVNRIIGSDVRGVSLRERPLVGWMDGVKRLLNERNIFAARKDDCT